MRQRNLTRLDKLQPKATPTVWLVEDFNDDEFDRVRVSCQKANIQSEMFPRNIAHAMTANQLCLWVRGKK